MKNYKLLLILLALLLLPVAAQSKSRLIHTEWEPQDIENIAGYRLYLENTLVCETNDPAVTTLDCTVEADDGPSTFHITSFRTDGMESQPSEPYNYIFSEDLKAVVAADVLEGESPLSVNFDAASSTGNIISYTWQFGDGESADGQSVNHTFTSSGSYTVELKVENDLGATHREFVAISVTTPSPVNIAPTAVVSSSTSVGEAPLAVHFNGSGSTDPDGTILQYQWDMGDGSTASGQQVSHTYTLAGTFSATLTVTDDGGLSDSVSTPVIITQPQQANTPPVAVITANKTHGVAPLSVTFDAGGSYDSDGTISRYAWNFGDGTTATGVNTSHVYSKDATYTVALDVTDDDGATTRATYSITVEPQGIDPSLPFEAGEVLVSSTWNHVDFIKQYNNPVVIAGPPSYNDDEPAVIRLRNVDSNGFDIRIQEWDYLDGVHGPETIHFIVMEQGNYTLNDGTKLEAGSFTASNQNFNAVQFGQSFQVNPVVFTSVATYNGSEAVAGRVRNIGKTGFEYALNEQESKRKTNHAEETIGYIASEPTVGSISNVKFAMGRTADTVTHNWYRIDLQTSIDAPFFFAAMQSTDGGDTASLRYRELTSTDVEVFVEEETSKDNEIKHTTETVGYMVLGTDSN